MTRSERDSLLLVGTLLFLVGLTVIGWLYLGKVNPVYPLAVLLLYEYLYVIPKISEYYHQLRGYEPKLTRYIPFWSEIEFFSPMTARILGISYIVEIIFILIAVLPVTGFDPVGLIVSSVFGETAAMRMSFVFFLLSVLLALVIVCVIQASGYMAIKRYLNREFSDDFGLGVIGLWDKIYYVILIVPVFRVVALNNIYTKLRKLVLFREAEARESEDFTYLRKGE